MVYRAKITKVQDWIESHYNINKWHLVKDSKDVYIEIDNPDEADLIEDINRVQEQLTNLKLKWYDLYEKL